MFLNKADDFPCLLIKGKVWELMPRQTRTSERGLLSRYYVNPNLAPASLQILASSLIFVMTNNRGTVLVAEYPCVALFSCFP
jgi:hypothetical protein